MAYRNNLEGTEWVTADGQVLKPRDMSNSHLLNTLLYLERNASAIKTQRDLELADTLQEQLLSITGLEDKDVIKGEIMKVWKQEPSDWIQKTPIYKALYAEVNERDLLDLLHTLRTRQGAYSKEIALRAETPNDYKVSRHPRTEF